MEVLLKPINTEKLAQLTDKKTVYGFLVDCKANKIVIKKAVEAHYSVTVTSVNTSSFEGKKKNRFTKAGFISGRTNRGKRAYITLAPGDKIDFFENI